MVRRQLLEYYLAFDPQGILLLDMEKRKIQTIEFAWGQEDRSKLVLIGTALVGVLLGMLIWKYFN